MNQQIALINERITEECIEWLVTASQGRVDRSEVIAHVAEIVECSRGTIDACSHCGSMPMTTNCNNANCS